MSDNVLEFLKANNLTAVDKKPNIFPNEEAWRFYGFANGLHLSCIRHSASYGGPEGFYEIAVAEGKSLIYDSPITRDVEGWLTEDDVISIIKFCMTCPRKGKVTWKREAQP